MEQILLTPEEIKAVEAKAALGSLVLRSKNEIRLIKKQAIAQAQLKKVAEWGDERVMCEHLSFYHKRVSCERCWQALKAELEGG